jgi:hypothetical protein
MKVQKLQLSTKVLTGIRNSWIIRRKFMHNFGKSSSVKSLFACYRDYIKRLKVSIFCNKIKIRTIFTNYNIIKDLHSY